MAHDLISTEQYAELRKAFLRCTSDEKRRQMIEKKAIKFAKANSRGTIPSTYTINAYLGMIKPHLYRHKTTHQPYCEAHNLQVRAELLTYTSDGVLKLMNDIGFKGTKTKKPEQLAKELVRVGGKDFFTKLIEETKKTTQQADALVKNEEYIRIHSREHKFAEQISAITNFTVLKGHDSWHSWQRVIDLKGMYVEHLEEELKDAKGATKTVLNDLLKKLPTSKDLRILSRLIEVNSFAVRLLNQWYLNENFDHLTDDIHDFVMGIVAIMIVGNSTVSATPTHNGVMLQTIGDNTLHIVRGKVKEMPMVEVVFRKDDAYIDAFHHVFDIKDPIIKSVIKRANDIDTLLEECIKSIKKRIGQKTITYEWGKFYTNSITIDEDFHKLFSNDGMEERIANVEQNFTNLYDLLNVATDQSKSFGHTVYIAQRDKKTIKKTS